jgi:hypothetical protein
MRHGGWNPFARKAKTTRISDGALNDSTAGPSHEPTMFVVACFECGARHSLDVRFKGQRIKCRACGAMFDTDRQQFDVHSSLEDT